jgi:hypothetical protein
MAKENKKFKGLFVSEEIHKKVTEQAKKENLKLEMMVTIMVNGYLIAKDYKNENI